MNKIFNFFKLPRIYIWTIIAIIISVFFLIISSNVVWLGALIRLFWFAWVLILYYFYILINLFIEKFYKIWKGLILLPMIIYGCSFLYQMNEDRLSQERNAWHRQPIKKVKFPPEYYLEYWQIKASDLELVEKVKLFDALKEEYSID